MLTEGKYDVDIISDKFNLFISTKEKQKLKGIVACTTRKVRIYETFKTTLKKDENGMRKRTLLWEADGEGNEIEKGDDKSNN